MMNVIKRDGTVCEFNTIKIAEAIKKAFDASGEPFENNQTTTPYILADEVEHRVSDKAPTIPIEYIQDTVEKVLMEHKYVVTAKSYILYRQKRTDQREKNTRLMNMLEEMFNNKNSNALRENANVNGQTAMGSMLKFGSTTANEYVNQKVLSPEQAEAHINGDIHIHDKDFLSIGTTTCSQINIEKLFKGGFNTGHGSLRDPATIKTAAQLVCVAIQANQNEQHGGQSIPNFDRFMAPYVVKSYRKIILNILNIICDADVSDIDTALKDYISTHSSILDEAGQTAVRDILSNAKNIDLEKVMPIDRIMKKALEELDKETYQAMEAFIHNLNTMHSRAGAQVPFSSINYGTDTSEEARLVVKNVLLATEAGLGNGETPIFPIQIFRMKHGINFEEGEPNYDLYQLSLRVTAKRLFPNYSFQDAPFNYQYYDPANPATEIAYMGCRTRVIGNVNGPEETYGRGNLSFTSINLPRLGILAEKDWSKFFQLLDEKLNLVAEQLLDRYKIQCQKHVRNFPFLMGEGIWNNGEKLSSEDTLEEILKQGTLSIGFIGLAETLIAMMGVHHGESDEAQQMGLEIVRHIRQFCDKKAAETGLNFSCLATPAEGLSGRFVKIDKKKFGVIKGVTDKEYYTNSFHVPVGYKTNFAHKLDVEGPYHELTNGGHISYIELSGDPEKNIEVLDKVVKYMDKCHIGYGAINHPLDRDPVCGYAGIIEGDTCPNCGRKVSSPNDVQFDRIRRITGYLVGTLDRFNDAKKAEVRDRVKHDK